MTWYPKNTGVLGRFHQCTLVIFTEFIGGCTGFLVPVWIPVSSLALSFGDLPSAPYLLVWRKVLLSALWRRSGKVLQLLSRIYWVAPPFSSMVLCYPLYTILFFCWKYGCSFSFIKIKPYRILLHGPFPIPFIQILLWYWFLPALMSCHLHWCKHILNFMHQGSVYDWYMWSIYGSGCYVS